MVRKPIGELRRGWTTGACATAALKAALLLLWHGERPTKVQITLPRGETPTFDVEELTGNHAGATASVVKDAGDDPDVTHGALISVSVKPGENGIRFLAGEGVGIITKPGLPLPVGEPAINPMPRQMMREVVAELSSDLPAHVDISVSIQNGAEIAAKTWNPRLGIVGGLSVLGTTGIVRPFSCSAWIASIHRGIDVARADGQYHVAGCTGATSERVVQDLYGLPDHAMLDMGDFLGGMLKYLSRNPVERLTIGGGIGKMTKLAQGATDLHSGRSQVDFVALSRLAGNISVAEANTAAEALDIVPDLGARIAQLALAKVTERLPETLVDTVVIKRDGTIVGRAG